MYQEQSLYPSDSKRKTAGETPFSPRFASPRALASVFKWPPFYVVGGGLILLFLQLLSGTDPLYALLAFVFLLLTSLTIKAVGGLNTLMGLCVAFLAAQHVLISQC